MTLIPLARLIVWALVASVFASPNALPQTIAEEPISFRNQIAPILVRSCLGCHKTGRAESGFNLETVALLKRGGVQVQEETLVPGRPDESHLVEVIRPDAQPRMPYKQPPLSDAEIALIETWVAQGASFDVPSEEETRLVTLVDPLTVLPAVAPVTPPREPVGAVAFTPDGQSMVASFGNRLQRFDAAQGTPRGQPLELPGRIAALGFTPKGNALWVAGGRPGLDGFVALVDPTAWTLRAQARGHADAILDAAATPDGHRLVTVSYDRLGFVWSLIDDQNESTAPTILQTLKEHTDAVHAVAVSPDGRLIATGSADRSVKVWDAATGTRLVTLSEATGPQLAVAFGPEPNRLTAAGADRALRVWTLRTNWDRQPPTATAELAQTRLAHRDAVQRLLRWNDRLASVGADRALKLWILERDGWNPTASCADQSDWPRSLAIAPDGDRLALGRLDGTLDLFNPTNATVLLALTPQTPAPSPNPTATSQPAQPPPPTDAKPPLFRAATLDPPHPRGVVRGRVTRLNLTGTHLQHATAARVPQGWSVTLVPLDPPKPNTLALDLHPPADAPLEPVALSMMTPYGITNSQLVDVLTAPELNAAEPNDPSQPLVAPDLSETDDLVIVGAIDKPGDVDAIRFHPPSGQVVRLTVAAESFGSPLRAELTLRHPDTGAILRQIRHATLNADPSLDLDATNYKGPVVVELRDQAQDGSGNHLYRLRVGSFARIDRLECLGVPAGVETTLTLTGANLKDHCARVNAVSTPPGTILTLPALSATSPRAGTPRKVVVADGPQFVTDSPAASDSNQPDGSSSERALAIPSGVTARLNQPGASRDHWFRAVAGQPVVVEVFARRLGLALDSFLEILDEQGNPIPRAVLRPVAETQVTFRDHSASSPGIRLSRWDHLRMGDLLLAGRELMRIRELPRNPDDDCQFEAFDGRRLGFLETTPEQHPVDQLMRKVEVHPPDTVFPDQSSAPLTLTFSNDDGGPGFASDSRVTFLPPRDGLYRARVSDARGFGPESEPITNDDFAYHLVIRPTAPSFQPRLSPAEPIVPAGGATLVTLTLERRDGFTGAVRIEPLESPPGLTITPTVVEANRFEAEVLIAADADAAPFFAHGLALKAVAVDHPDDPAWQRTIKSGPITVARMNDLTIEPISTEPITLKPGGVTTFAFRVNRLNPEIGRIPVEFRNLPYGTRVLNIGLNGILVTPQETERVVELYAEPWVRPTRRPVYPAARVEATRQVIPVSAPVELIIDDQPTAAAESSSDENES